MRARKKRDLGWRVSVREDTISVTEGPPVGIYLSLPCLSETVFERFWHFRMGRHRGFQTGLGRTFKLDHAIGQRGDERVFILC